MTWSRSWNEQLKKSKPSLVKAIWVTWGVQWFLIHQLNTISVIKRMTNQPINHNQFVSLLGMLHKSRAAFSHRLRDQVFQRIRRRVRNASLLVHLCHLHHVRRVHFHETPMVRMFAATGHEHKSRHHSAHLQQDPSIVQKFTGSNQYWANIEHVGHWSVEVRRDCFSFFLLLYWTNSGNIRDLYCLAIPWYNNIGISVEVLVLNVGNNLSRYGIVGWNSDSVSIRCNSKFYGSHVWQVQVIETH